MLALLNNVRSVSYINIPNVNIDFEIISITTIMPTSGNTAINTANFPGLTSSNVTITISTTSPVDILIPAALY